MINPEGQKGFIHLNDQCYEILLRVVAVCYDFSCCDVKTFLRSSSYYLCLSSSCTYDLIVFYSKLYFVKSSSRTKYSLPE